MDIDMLVAGLSLIALRGWCGGAAAAQQQFHLCVIHEKKAACHFVLRGFP